MTAGASRTPIAERYVMSSTGMRFAYFLCKRGSMAIHGSGIDEFLISSSDGGWFPRVADVDGHWQPRATMVAGNLEGIYLMLTRSSPLVWEIDDQPPESA